jgi:L-alanine-DL-glutamate epimerase-like enolase superfamily enzyme
MKLRDLDIIVTAPPAPGWGGRYWILVKLTSDSGVVGWGEVYAAAVGPEAMAAVIRDVFGATWRARTPRTWSSCSVASILQASRNGPIPRSWAPSRGLRSPAGTWSARTGAARSTR